MCKALNRVYNAQRSDWDLHVLVVLWAYRTTCKKLLGQTPSRVAYEATTLVQIEYSMPSLRIAVPIDMMVCEALEEGITQLNEEECLGPEEEIQQGDLRL